MNDTATPEVIYYAETGGKSAPFYRTLGGIRSAFKTSWGGRTGWQYKKDGRPQVFRGEVTWTEIDLETGKPVAL